MLFLVHQCMRFSNCPKESHKKAVKWIGKYLKGTHDKGIIMTLDLSEGIKCYVDADFAGGWYQQDAEDPVTVMSCTGYVIYFAN